MKELEDFYNNHFKTDQMMDWSELTDNQKKALKNCLSYRSFQRDKAINEFRLAIQKEIDKIINVVKRFR